jgi:microcystin-dependent protein
VVCEVVGLPGETKREQEKARLPWWLIPAIVAGPLLVGGGIFVAWKVGSHEGPQGPQGPQGPRGPQEPGGPSGSIVAFGGRSAPDGWLLCDGARVSRSKYVALYAAVGSAWGGGDGATTFNLPDLRGVFLRGVDAGANRDPDAASRTASAAGGNVGGAVGTIETDDFRSHNHGGSTGGVAANFDTNAARDYLNSGDNRVFAYTSAGAVSNLFREHTHSINAAGGHETRPINVAVNYIIKM